MLIKVPHFGYVLTDSQNLPRFWASAWALLIGGSLAPSTLKLRLRRIEAFYRHAEDGHPQGMLDDAIADQNLALLEEFLESYFITLRNVPDVSSGTEQRWRDAVEFVRTISERLLSPPDMSARLADITLRLERLDRLYGQLRVGKKSAPLFVRALPAAVLAELFELVVPGAEAKPFKSPATQWRVYCTFLLLLNAGLATVAQLGGMGKLAKFYERFREVRDRLSQLNALPDQSDQASATPIIDENLPPKPRLPKPRH